jgi:hypothetical protein
VAAFTEGVPLDSILLLAEADERYTRALERRGPLRREAIGVKDESGMHTSMGAWFSRSVEAYLGPLAGSPDVSKLLPMRDA